MTQQARKTNEYERTVLVTPEPGPGTRAPAPSVSEAVQPELVRAPDNDPLLGAELAGAYVIEGVIGEGGMGRLYQARHLRLDRPFAVKVIHTPLSQREDLRARFEREARVMSRVRSDHVVDIIDVVRAPDGRTCIINEFLEGRDLESHLVSVGGKLSQGEAVSLARQCLRGLSAAHSMGVVHRDLKPSNLFLAKDTNGRPTLKVLDFGVAKSSGDAEVTSTGVIVGTPAYMAPEQARGASHADARSDLYAVGAVLYRMVTGKSPYSDSDASGTLIRLMEESPPRPSLIERSISPGLEAVIEKAMARDRAERYQTSEALDAALAPFDASRSATLTSGDEAKALGRQARLVRPLAVLVASTLALLTGLSIAAVLSLLVQGLSSHAQMGTTELVLVLLGSAVAGIGAAMAEGRALANTWANAAMVKARTKRTLRALMAGAMTLGALELAATLWIVFMLKTRVSSAPFWVAGRLLVALLCASAVGLGFGARKR